MRLAGFRGCADMAAWAGMRDGEWQLLRGEGRRPGDYSANVYPIHHSLKSMVAALYLPHQVEGSNQ